jgi:hypothetical protein
LIAVPWQRGSQDGQGWLFYARQLGALARGLAMWEGGLLVCERGRAMADRKEAEAAVAGQLLHPWMPYGGLRKAIFVVLVCVGFVGLYVTQNYFFLIALVLASLMSPRLIGGLAFNIGRISRLFQ